MSYQALDVPVYSWLDYQITTRTVPDMKTAGKAQPKVMANLQQMLKLMLKDELSKQAELKIVDFLQAEYSLNEQCVGFSELYSEYPEWFIQVWNSLCLWKGQDLATLEKLLKQNISQRRTINGNGLDDALLLMKEAWEKQSGDTFPPIIPKLKLSHIEKKQLWVL